MGIHVVEQCRRLLRLCHKGQHRRNHEASGWQQAPWIHASEFQLSPRSPHRGSVYGVAPTSQVRLPNLGPALLPRPLPGLKTVGGVPQSHSPPGFPTRQVSGKRTLAQDPEVPPRQPQAPTNHRFLYGSPLKHRSNPDPRQPSSLSLSAGADEGVDGNIGRGALVTVEPVSGARMSSLASGGSSGDGECSQVKLGVPSASCLSTRFACWEEKKKKKKL